MIMWAQKTSGAIAQALVEHNIQLVLPEVGRLSLALKRPNNIEQDGFQRFGFDAAQWTLDVAGRLWQHKWVS